MKLTRDELRLAFDGSDFPPILDVDQAAALARVSRKTIYDWSHRGLLEDCAKRRGKHLLFWRDRFVEFLFSGDVP